MTDTHLHANHTHQHGPGCGHTAIVHGGHVDYLHDGHLHHMRSDGTVEEHTISVDNTNPGGCVGKINHGEHQHGPDCGHEAIPHGDHIDYLMEGLTTRTAITATTTARSRSSAPRAAPPRVCLQS